MHALLRQATTTGIELGQILLTQMTRRLCQADCVPKIKSRFDPVVKQQSDLDIGRSYPWGKSLFI